MTKRYGMNNAKEYFAESTEAFFGKNDFFPFDKEELRAHDPKMHDLLIELWGVRANTDQLTSRLGSLGWCCLV